MYESYYSVINALYALEWNVWLHTNIYSIKRVIALDPQDLKSQNLKPSEKFKSWKKKKKVHFLKN